MAKGKKFGREKKVIIFNEDSRRDYLLGFRKRKNERRQKALDDIKRKEIEKVKRMKLKKREDLMEHLKKQREELDALESEEEEVHVSQDDTSPIDETYVHPEHIVTVTTVCDVDLDGGSTTIGCNKSLPDMSEPKNNIVEEKGTKDKLFENKIKKYSKNNKFQRKRSKDNHSSKFHPKKKRKN